MQSTHKIPGGSATTWSKYLISQASRGDYYTQDGQSAPTQWHGPEKLLRSYGIDPGKPVELKDLRSLMHGFSPVDGEAIRPAGSDKTRVAAVDLTYSPPKDVSALWATADPYRRAQIEAAHRKAVKSALQRTEREVALVRRKTDGVVRFERSKRLLAIEAVHTSSRLGKGQDSHGIPDPQLHSHVAVIAAERKDGQLAAVESKQLFRAARENGAWYRSELAANLKELGLSIERRQGNNERYFAIHGVSKELSEHWSSRSQDVDQAAQIFRRRYGREPRAGELDSLTLGTRGSKSAARSTDVNAAWRALGSEHDQTARRSEELFNDWGLRNEPKVDLARELLAEVTREKSMITERELRAKAYELSAGICRPTDADRLLNDLERSGELVRLEGKLWTTQTHRDLEQATLDIATERATENTAPVSDQARKQARREVGKEIHGSLTQEQREALETITGTGGLSVLVGQAGTGKGVVIATAARAWQLEGNEVIGTAIAGATAQRLQADAKLDKSYTTDGLLNGVESGHIRLDRNTVVAIDEAGMADSDRLSRLVKLTGERESKLLLAGDAAQLSSIGAGGLFKEIEGKVPTAELTEVHRANHEWERAAWEQIRNGEPGPALAQYQAHDRLHIHDTRAQAAEAMIDNWDETRRSLPNGQAVMITDASNKERDQMNALAQDRRAQAGELGAHHVELPGKPYGLASGDEIIFSAQHYPPGEKRVENGITGTITHAGRDKDRVTIKTREREPRDVQVDTSEFNDIGLAYAVHVHKAQGLTAETSGILTGNWQTDREHTYVAASRARERTDIYIAREDLGEQGLDTGAIERLAERMQQSRAQEASITMRLAQDRPEAPERSKEQPAQIEPATQATPERIVDHPEPERSTEASQQHDPPAQTAEPRVQDSTEIPSPCNASHATESEIDEVLQARRERQFDWQRAIDVDRSGNADEQAQEVQAIEHLAEQLRGEGASEATITQEIAKQTTGREAALERNTHAQAEHERYIDKVLGQQRQRLLDEEQQHIDRRNTDLQAASTPEPDREPQRDQPAQIEPGEQNIDQAKDADHDPYIEQAIQDAQDRQQAWEQGIDQDRDNDRSFGIE
jgi:conjugative relaxase-like TrwC/TraI family protein